MLAMNNQLFLFINAGPGAPPALVHVAEFIASQLIDLIPFLLVGLWIWGRRAARPGLLATSTAAGLALGANQLVGFLWYEPRPFMIGLGRTLIPHVPENSFPSDHTTFILAVGIALMTTRAAPTWGKAVIVLGGVVAWSRIYLGLHYPIDMLGSAVIAGLFGSIAALLASPVGRWIMPFCDWIYEGVLATLRLPPRIFPRRRDPA